MTRKSQIYYWGIAALAIGLGLSFYANFRLGVVTGYPQLLVEAFMWSNTPKELPDFVLSSFPSFVFIIYMSAIGWAMLKKINAYVIVLAVLAFGLASEALQATTLLQGIYDLADMAAMLFAAAFSVVLFKIISTVDNSPHNEMSLTIPRKAGFTVLTLMGCFSVVGSTIEYDCTDSDSYEECVTPVFLTDEELREDIVPVYGSETGLKRPGKVYVYNDMLFIADNYSGIHIFDNTDIENPTSILFVPVRGSTEISISNDVLYTNSYIDLVAIELLPLLSESFTQENVNRNEDYLSLPEDYWYDLLDSGYDFHPDYWDQLGVDGKIVIGYEKEDGTQVIHGEVDQSTTGILIEE